MGKGNKQQGEIISPNQDIIKIDRSSPFDVRKFFGEEYVIWREDHRSVKKKMIDLTKVFFVSTLMSDEESISGEEKLKRLIEQGYIRLDAKILQTFFENQEMIPSLWRPKEGSRRYVFFDGTILENENEGGLFTPYLTCLGNEPWEYSFNWVGNMHTVELPSIVLPQQFL